MADKFVVLTRYECWQSGPVKDFTKWFILDNEPRTKKECEEVIKKTKARYADIDRKMKEKHEYKLLPYEEYLADLEETKKAIEEGKKRDAAYYKSDAYKELQKKKRQSAKERKEKQKKYLEEHQNNDKTNS